MYQQLLLQLILFLVYLFPQAMIINGIFLAGQGSTEILPDGTEKNSEMILYPIYKFLHQTSTVQVFFRGKQYDELVTSIKNKYSMLSASIEKGNGILIENNAETILYWKSFSDQIEKVFNIKITFNANKILLSREYQEYKFSKYLRKPILGCVICMSSFWSIFTFLIPALCTFHSPVIYALFIPNCFCLAYLNYKIYKPL